MNIRLTPHSEELLRQQLSQGGFRSPEEVIELALETLSAPMQTGGPIGLAEFDAALDALAEGSERLTVLAPQATKRAEIYRDHN